MQLLKYCPRSQNNVYSFIYQMLMTNNDEVEATREKENVTRTGRIRQIRSKTCTHCHAISCRHHLILNQLS